MVKKVKPASQAGDRSLYMTSREDSGLPWNLLERLCGKRLTTISQEKVFSVTEVTEDHVTVRLASTGKIRNIARDEFESVWRSMSQQFKVSWNEVRDKHSSVNPSYIIAILSRLPGVWVSACPLEIGLRTSPLCPRNHTVNASQPPPE